MAEAAAEATPPDSSPDTETLLHCSVCKENFHPKSRLPRYLPCHHIFCGECLEKLEQDGQVKCPMCRRVAEVDGPFPVDDTHITFLELRLPAQAEEAPPCEDCPDKEKATVRCQDCSANLCDACSKAHKRVKATRNHTVIDLSEIAQNPELYKLAPAKCGIHMDRPLEFFCKTCDKPICAACAAMRHRDGHRVEELDKVIEAWRDKVMAESENFSCIIEGLETKAASLKTILEDLDSDHNRANEDIETTFVELQTALNARKAALLAELAARVKANRLALEEELATVESQISSSKATRDYSQRLLHYGLPSQLAAYLSDKEIEALVQEAIEVKETYTDGKPVGLERKGLQQVKSAIETFGNICDGAITWTLQHVQNLTENRVFSDPAYFGGAEWRLFTRSRQHSGSRQLCLNLACSMPNTKPWSFYVRYDLRVLNLRDRTHTKSGISSAFFSAREDCWGFNLLSMRRVTDPGKGYVKDGKVSVQGSFKLDLSEGMDYKETRGASAEENSD